MEKEAETKDRANMTAICSEGKSALYLRSTGCQPCLALKNFLFTGISVPNAALEVHFNKLIWHLTA